MTIKTFIRNHQSVAGTCKQGLVGQLICDLKCTPLVRNRDAKAMSAIKKELAHLRFKLIFFDANFFVSNVKPELITKTPMNFWRFRVRYRVTEHGELVCHNQSLGFKYSNNDQGDEVRTERTRVFSPAYIQLGVGIYWKQSNSLWVNFAPVTGRLILASKKFTNDLENDEEYFGIPRGQNSRFELGASISAFYKFELIENVMLEQRVNLYSDYLNKADNIDVDYTLSAFMKINDYLSTTLIIQCLYDDNAIKKIQLREVFGLAFVIDILEIPNII